MTKELKRFEKWWDAGDDIPNDGPYTPDTPIQFAWAGWQAALAQPVQEPVAWMRQDGQRVTTASDRHNYPDYETRYSIPLYTHPPQPAPVQEPPAWFPAVENILKVYGLQAIDFVADFKEAMKDAEQSHCTWVGLTDEERQDIALEVPMDAVCITETKLKEKNT